MNLIRKIQNLRSIQIWIKVTILIVWKNDFIINEHEHNVPKNLQKIYILIICMFAYTLMQVKIPMTIEAVNKNIYNFIECLRINTTHAFLSICNTNT